jgi:iron complex outermembrane receptor protein
MPRRLPFFAKLFMLAALFATGIALAPQPVQAQTGERSYDIPAGPLSAALARFAAQAGVALSADARLTEGKTTRGLKGRYGVQAGLDALLSGSGLEARPGAGGFVVQRVAAAAEKEPALPEVIVRERPQVLTSPAATVGILGDRPVLDTPFTVNSYTEELIRQQQASTIGDVTKNDPGVTSTIDNAGRSFYSTPGLRGFPPVFEIFLYDGLPGTGTLFGFTKYPLNAIERVDVLKGPSAFLAAADPFFDVGGRVNLVPKRPAAAPLTAVALRYEADSLWTLEGDFSRRFGERDALGVRLNAMLERGEPAIAHARNKAAAFDLGFDWRIAPNFKLSGTLHYDKYRHDAFQRAFHIGAGVPVPAPPDPRTDHGQPWTFQETEPRHAYLRADWSLASDWTATLQYFRGNTGESSLIAAPTIINAAGDTTQGVFHRPRIERDFDGWQAIVRGKLATGALKHELTFGVQASTEEFGVATRGFGTNASNLYSPRYVPQPTAVVFSFPFGRLFEHGSSGLAVSDLISWGERWSVLLGARRQRIELKRFSLATGAQTDTYDRSKLTPSAALMFKPGAKSMLYLSYIEGLIRGGTAPLTAANAGEVLPPLETSQYELGGKIEVANGMLLTAALFDIDRGLEFLDPATNRFGQFGRQRHRGLEVSASGPLTPHLTLLGGFMLLDAVQERTGVPATEGKKVFGTPAFTLPLNLIYRLPDAPGLSLSAGLYYFGKQFVDATNARSIPSWTRLDVGAAYETRIAGRTSTLRVGIENLADRRYWSSASFGLLFLGAPRTVKATLQVDF